MPVMSASHLDHFAKLAKVFRTLEQVLIAELQRQTHHIHQVPLHHPHILRPQRPSQHFDTSHPRTASASQQTGISIIIKHQARRRICQAAAYPQTLFTGLVTGVANASGLYCAIYT